MIKARKLRHATFATPDLQRTVEYYTHVLGLVAVASDKSAASLATGVGDVALHLKVGPEANCTGLTFEVAPDEELATMVKDSRADIVTVGHYHRPMERMVDGIHCINAASVSNPQPGDRRASYVTIDANADSYAVNFHRVDYDYQAVIDSLYRVRHPVADYIAAFWNNP